MQVVAEQFRGKTFYVWDFPNPISQRLISIDPGFSMPVHYINTKFILGHKEFSAYARNVASKQLMNNVFLHLNGFMRQNINPRGTVRPVYQYFNLDGTPMSDTPQNMKPVAIYDYRQHGWDRFTGVYVHPVIFIDILRWITHCNSLS